MEENKSFKVDYLFYKSTVIGILGLIVGVVLVTLLYIIGVCEYILDDMDLGGYYNWVLMLFLLPYLVVVFLLASKWLFPQIKLKEVVAGDQTISFYRVDKVLSMRYEDVTKVDVAVDKYEGGDAIMRVSTYYFYTTKGNYSLVMDYSKEKTVLSDEFHQVIRARLRMEEYSVKQNGGTNKFVRTYKLKS